MPRARGEVRITVEPQFLHNILARCRNCGGFAFVSQMAVLACGTCDHHTAKCTACGGAESVHAGLVLHLAYWARRPEADHGAHERAYALYKKLNPRKRNKEKVK